MSRMEKMLHSPTLPAFRSKCSMELCKQSFYNLYFDGEIKFILQAAPGSSSAMSAGRRNRADATSV